MVYLIYEQTVEFTPKLKITEKLKGYYECETEEDVKVFCDNETEELKETYDIRNKGKVLYYKQVKNLKNK